MKISQILYNFGDHMNVVMRPFKKLHVFLKKILYTHINVGKFGIDGSLVLKCETKAGTNDHP